MYCDKDSYMATIDVRYDSESPVVSGDVLFSTEKQVSAWVAGEEAVSGPVAGNEENGEISTLDHTTTLPPIIH